MKDLLIRVRLCARHLIAAMTALQFWGDHLHEAARQESADSSKAEKIRAEAEDVFAARKSLWSQYQGDEVNLGSQASAPHASASNASITGVPPNMLWANTIFVGATFVLSIIAIYIALWNIKEAKQVQIQLMYTNALMIREGLVQPGDMVYGPEGNLEYNGKSFKPKK